MKNLFKILAGSTLAAFAALTASQVSMPKQAEANDGCGGSAQSRRAEKVTGGAGYPTVCRTTICHTHNASAVKSHVDMNGGFVIIDFVYKIDNTANAPTNSCPSDVQSGGTTGWQSN